MQTSLFGSLIAWAITSPNYYMIGAFGVAVIVAVNYWGLRTEKILKKAWYARTYFWLGRFYHNHEGQKVAKIHRSIVKGAWVIDYYGVAPQMTAKFWDKRADVKHDVETYVRDQLYKATTAKAIPATA